MRVSLVCLVALLCVALGVCRVVGSPSSSSEGELARLHAILDQWEDTAIVPLINSEADLDRLEQAVQPHEPDVALIEQAAQSDSDQEIDVVVDQNSSAEDKAEQDALMQNEVDAELDVDADTEAESTQEAQVEASEPEIEAAKIVLNAVTDDAAEDYPAMAEVASDSDQEIDVVVDQDSSAENKAEQDALMQNEVDAELDTDSETEATHENEVEASDPEIAAAHAVLNAVVDEAAEDYPSLAEVTSDSNSEQEIEVVVDQDASAEEKSEADALMQNEVDAELDVDADVEAEATQEAQVEASEPEIEAAKTVLNAVTDDAAEDYPAMAEVASDSDQEIDVVVDQDSSAENQAEQDALMQNEVDAELDTDSETEATHESEVDASDPEIAAAHAVLNAVVDEAAEDYPSLAEIAHDPIVHPVVWSGSPASITAKRPGEIDPVMIKASAKKLESSSLPAGERSLISFAEAKEGCGSGATRSVTPQLHFKPACIVHDGCYDRCDRTQLECDQQFEQAMLAICAQRNSRKTPASKAAYKVCESQAAVYYRVVRVFGSTPFRDSQRLKCPARST